MANKPTHNEHGKPLYPKWLWIDDQKLIPLKNEAGEHLMATSPMEEDQLFTKYDPNYKKPEDDNKNKKPSGFATK